jgi:signal transduction histidine kinase
VTRRILAGFIAVLLAVLAAMVVPLGVVVTAQQRRDFRDAARNAASAVAALAEERLDDHSQAVPFTAGIAGIVRPGDSVVVLDRAGSVVGQAGPAIPASLLIAARAGAALPASHGRIVVSSAVGDSKDTVGLVILTRGTAPAEQRRRNLWLALTGAAIGALVVGAVVAAGLARWIARPLQSLVRTARMLGRGEITARADNRSGPAQVRDVAGAFNDMADRVARLLEMQRGMTAEVSHQLRTPLAAMRLRLELLATEVDEDLTGDVTMIVAETSRLSRLVDGLLAVARADATPSTPVATDLTALVAARVAAWEPVADERSVSLTGTGTARAAVTAGHVEQILDNLIDNALDAVPPGGQITVSIGHRNGRTLLIVADNGPGMSSQQMAHAFDRFVTDRAANGGTGLGLAVVDRLVTSDGGNINLVQSNGGGLTVEVSLPAAN